MFCGEIYFWLKKNNFFPSPTSFFLTLCMFKKKDTNEKKRLWIFYYFVYSDIHLTRINKQNQLFFPLFSREKSIKKDMRRAKRIYKPEIINFDFEWMSSCKMLEKRKITATDETFCDIIYWVSYSHTRFTSFILLLLSICDFFS